MTFSTFLSEIWLPAIERTVRETTFVNYRSHILQHVTPRIGTLPISQVDGRALNSLYAQLLARGRANDGGALSPTTVLRIHATLHRALRDAVRWGYLSDNPADRCDPPRGHTRFGDMNTWEPDQLRTFLENLRDDRLFALWLTLAMTGLRRGEALGLRWRDVDLNESQLAVRQTIVAAGYEVRISGPKTGRGRRLIALDQQTVQALKEHHRRQVREKRSQPDYRDHDLVFCSPDGSCLHPCQVSKRFRKLVEASGLPPIRLHDLRHTHATLALRAGVHPKIVSERLGHATVALTLDVYSHAVAHMQAEAAEAVAKLVLG